MPFRVIDERMEVDTRIFAVVVPEDCPYFHGHFPGLPVMPAIGQLALLAGLLTRVIGSAVSLTGVNDLRLSRQMSPGHHVEVRLEDPRGGDTARFEIRRDGAFVSGGTLRIAPGIDG